MINDFTNLYYFAGQSSKLRELRSMQRFSLYHTVSASQYWTRGDALERWQHREQCGAGQAESSLLGDRPLSLCFTVYRSLTGLWNSPHRTGRKRSVTGHRLNPHQTAALRRRPGSWVSETHTHIERGRRELTVSITGEMIENKACFYLQLKKMYLRGLENFLLRLKKLL